MPCAPFQALQPTLPLKMHSFSLLLQPLQKATPDCRFSSKVLGHKKLNYMVQSMCSKAGIRGHKTNHSLRATTATRLFHAGIDEQLKMETTGHHSVDRVCSYKHTSQEQIANLSDILNVPVKKVHVAPQSTQQQHHAACTNFKGALTAPSPSTVEASLKLLSTVSYHDRCIHCNLHNMRFNTDALNKVYMWGHPPFCGICVFRARRHVAVVCDLCDL